MTSKPEKNDQPTSLTQGKPNVQFAASIDFLNTELMGAFENVGERKLFIAKQMDAGENAKGIKLSELAENLKGAVGFQDVNIAWPAPLGDMLDNYEAFIKQAYLKVEKNGSEQTKNEYALWIGVGLDEDGLKKLQENNPLFELVAIKELALKVWNTTNPTVLKEMNFVDIKKLIGSQAKALPA
ncbi:MAG: hypothetical protein GY860_19945 [Desulfobacteraceae bacterium]|nr:hypothetical protein [Desulfobacteraceae bacterium]